MAVEWEFPVGTHVCDVVVAPDNDRVYVAADGRVTVIAGSHIVGTVAVGPEPKRLVVGADGSYLFVPDYGGSLSIVSTTDMTAGTIAADPSTAEVVSPDGRRIYSAHPQTRLETGGSWISAVNADGTGAAAVSVENYATGMDLSPDGTRLYVATSRHSSYTQYYPGAVTVIDTASNAIVDTIAVPLSPDTVTASPDGCAVFITHYDTNAVSVIDVQRRSVTSISLPDAPLSAAVTPDGTGLYVVGLQSLVAVDIPAKIAEIIPAGQLPRGLQFSDDGKRAYLTDLGCPAVMVLDTITNSMIATVELDGHPEAVAVSGDGQRLYVADYWAGTLAAISIAAVLRDTEGA